MEEKFTFFWNGPFSQWYPSYFEIEEIEYNCAEQYMMAEKARLFGDEETLDMIMEAEDPKTQKKLGRLVEDFDQDEWEAIEDNGHPYCWNVVWKGNVAKFNQNSYLLEELFATAGTILVEASPFDVIWGIGLREDDPLALDRDNWRGANWLGEVLTDVREHLMGTK